MRETAPMGMGRLASLDALRSMNIAVMKVLILM